MFSFFFFFVCVIAVPFLGLLAGFLVHFIYFQTHHNSALLSSSHESPPLKQDDPLTLSPSQTHQAASQKRNPIHALVLLGSGGHTMEMLQLLSTLSARSTSSPGADDYNKVCFHHQTFVITERDTSSQSKLNLFLENYQFPQKSSPSILPIARARFVGQSWWTTPWTTLIAFFQAFRLLWNIRPQLVLCNGPGTCIPICIAANILNLLFRFHIVCFYIESIARVQHLSLSGKLFYHLRLGPTAVQWPILKLKYPRAYYKGILV